MPPPSAPVPGFLPPHGHVIVVVVDPAGVPDERIAACLSAAEQEQAARFRFEKDARHWRACRTALRGILGQALGSDPAELVFEFGEHGKPRLAPPHDGLHFNLSHCHDLALVALSRSGPLGIDLEPADRAGSLLGCETSFCHPEEIAALPTPAEARAAALLDLWTSKEALLKALGTGMSLAPESVSLAGPGGHNDHPRLHGFRLRPLHHPSLERHVARLATPQAMVDIEVREFTA